MGAVGGILALEGRAAVEQEEEEVEEGEEHEHNAPPIAAMLSVGAVVPLAVDTRDVGIWEGSGGWT